MSTLGLDPFRRCTSVPVQINSGPDNLKQIRKKKA